MNERTHDERTRTDDARERTAHAPASVQPKRAPELLTYAEAGTMTDHWVGGVSPESLTVPSMTPPPTTTPATSPARPTGVDIFARFPHLRGRTSAHDSRIGGNDARSLEREERASRVQPDERDVRIASLEAETAGLRERAAYAERQAEVRAQEVARLHDVIESQAIALRAAQAAAIPATILDVGPASGNTPVT
jgi:hypothetical protein